MTRHPVNDRRRAGARHRALAALARMMPKTYDLLYQQELLDWKPRDEKEA